MAHGPLPKEQRRVQKGQSHSKRCWNWAPPPHQRDSTRISHLTLSKLKMVTDLPWPPMCQGCRLYPGSRHIKESIKKCIHEWSNKSMPPLSNQ